ncbi:hypothetical protein TWF718_004255 [Orbilia javanica]|uniref:Uncharacterized protein n=1 Tax=Orbilia javanica TaxID=47235 RepID=A0AAN8N2B6_9PEZI
MTISWTPENYVKLLAALLAAHPELKLNYHNIAVYFGDGATYDAIEKRMRLIRNQANELRKEVETGVRPNVAPKPTPKKRAAGGQSKGKKGLAEEDRDDEEVITPAKKKAKLIEGVTPVSVKSEEDGSTRKKTNKSAAAPVVIDILDSDEENPTLSEINVKRETNPVVVKTETTGNTITYQYDSEDDYRE